jgi:hypothetical protein
MSDRTSTLTTGQKSPSNPEVGPRLVELLDRCGIAAAHFASRGTADLKGLLSQQPERVASLTVLCPAVLDTRTLARIGERLLIVTGDRGPGARRVQAGLPDLPRATAVVLDDYAGLTWSDIAAERGDGIVAAIRGFLSHHSVRTIGPLGEKRSLRNASIRELHRAAYRGGRKRYRRGRPSGSRRSDHSNTATASELQVRPVG